MRDGTAATVAGAVSLAALLAGSAFNPGPDHPRTAIWYSRLDKPELTPPGPVFAIAWSALDGLLAYTGYRLLRSRPGQQRRLGIGAWLVTLSGIPAYCWTFFGRRRADQGLEASAAMLAASATLTAIAARVDRKAALASAPLIAWLVFATFLQEEVWRKN